MKDPEKINVLVGGASGYAGQEAVEILEGHPHVDEIITFRSHDFPDARTLERADAAILALPHTERGLTALRLCELGKVVIDLSASFRTDPYLYRERYDAVHIAPELTPAPYGVVELNRDNLKGAKLIAGPGCFPTEFALATAPLIQNGLVRPDAEICHDAISGTSGMGKDKWQKAERVEASGEVQPPYKTGREHRHVGEMEQFLRGRQISFAPRLGPYFRGITGVIDIPLADGVTPHAAHATLAKAYESERLVRVMPLGEIPDVEDVIHTDASYIGVVETQSGVLVVAVIDNLGKGAAGQGIHCLNISMGLPEYAGLRMADTPTLTVSSR